MKTGAPTMDVIIPMGISEGANNSLATKSAKSNTEAPISIEAGNNLL